MKRKKLFAELQRVLLLIILGFSPLFVWGQEGASGYGYEILTSNDGLSNNYVTKILQDDKGIMWFATETGLDKYDGVNFIVYGSLSNKKNTGDNIETIFKDTDGNIWIGTKNDGLFYMNIKQNRIKRIDLSNNGKINTKTNRILCIAYKNRDEIYVGSWRSGLWLIDAKNLTVKNYWFPNETIHCLLKDGNEHFWVGQERNLLLLDSDDETVKKIPVPFRSVLTLTNDSANNALWVGSWKGLHKFDKATDEFNQPKGISYLNEVSVPILLKDHNDLWIGTWSKGLFKYNIADDYLMPFSFSTACNTERFSFPVVLDLFMDKYGTLWASGKDGVLKIIKKQPFNLICINSLTSDMHPSNTAIYIQDDVHLYGTEKGLIYNYNGNVGEIFQNRVNRIVQDNNGDIFLASNGVYKFNKQTNRTEQVIKQGQATDMVFDMNDTLWLASKEDGIFKYYIANNSYQLIRQYSAHSQDDTSLKSNRISRLLLDTNGTIWAATYNGLFYNKCDGNGFLSIEKKSNQKLSSQIINDIQLVRNKLYAATSNGLNIINLDTYTISNIESGLGISNNYLNAIQLDSRGNVWASTNYGINRYSFIDYSVKNFNSGDGVQSKSFIEATSFKDDKGYIYFGSSLGFVCFHPDSITFASTNPRVILANIRINYKSLFAGDTISRNNVLPQEIEYTNSLVLSYLDKVISINIATDDYIRESNIYYKHRLIGFEEDWIYEVNSPEITYTNLYPGNYTLEILASRNKDVLPDEKTELVIKVLPAPWKTGWAYAFYGLIIAAITSLVIRMATRASILHNKLKIEQIEKQNEKELTESKLRFFTNISHEFRTPLTLINGPLEDVLASESMDTQIRNKLHVVYQNSRRLMNLVNQLLEFRKIETGNDKLQVAEGNVVDFVREVYLSFQGLAERKSIDFSFNAKPKKISLWFDRDKMEILVCNLLSNAFKYTEAQGRVSVTLSAQENNFMLEVADSGRGISKSDQQRVFDRFYQIRNQETSNVMGSGIGLSLTKTIAQLHGGEIILHSTVGVGTSFTVVLPLGFNHFKQDELIKDFRNSNNVQHYKIDSEFHLKPRTDNQSGSENDVIILIIDDNKEIRDFVYSLLIEKYKVIEAENGKEGLELAKKVVPDLIISDVMMPVMDGIAFCAAVKQFEETSHIPVILLTARTSNIYYVSGLETGADDYITKPFAPDILKARVANLLSSREMLKEYYSKRVTLDDTGLQIPDKEAEFLNRAIKLVEDNMDSSTFSMKDLQQHLGMSQPTLYRKLKALTQESPSSFIRSIRLKHAAEILKKNGYNVNDAIYAAGFNDSKYFRDCFKKQFGCTPSQFIEQHRSKS